MSKTPNNLASSNRRRRRTALVPMLAAGALFLGPVRRAAACWFDPIIFDPSAMVEHVQEVGQLGQQIRDAATQIQNQLSELAQLASGIAPDVIQMVSGIEGQLDTAIYNTPDPADQLNASYPADMSSATWQQLESDASSWAGDQRQALVENRQVEDQVYQDMQTTAQQVAQIVQASNSAPGETAVTQANNDLLAVASGEFAKLQTLKSVRARLHTQALAQEQSELSFAAAEQARVWVDDPVPPSGTMTNAFGN